jgi:hypothetical protein
MTSPCGATQPLAVVECDGGVRRRVDGDDLVLRLNRDQDLAGTWIEHGVACLAAKRNRRHDLIRGSVNDRFGSTALV